MTLEEWIEITYQQ